MIAVRIFDTPYRISTVIVYEFKNAALEADSFINSIEKPVIEKKTKSKESLAGYVKEPVSLETDFFGTR